MKLALDHIYKCPNCSNLIKQGNLISGNTFGAKLFSDSKQFAPMLPNFTNLTKCKKCNAIFKISNLKEWGCKNYLTRLFWKGKCKKADSVGSLNTSDLYTALEMFPQDELYIRQQILWSLNDPLRSYSDYDQPISEVLIKVRELDTRFEENCHALLKLLDPSDENQKIMMAELYRNLGQFDKCIELINSIDTFSNRTELKHKLKKYFIWECEKENKFVFRIDNYMARKQKELTYSGLIKHFKL